MPGSFLQQFYSESPRFGGCFRSRKSVLDLETFKRKAHVYECAGKQTQANPSKPKQTHTSRSKPKHFHAFGLPTLALSVLGLRCVCVVVVSKQSHVLDLVDLELSVLALLLHLLLLCFAFALLLLCLCFAFALLLLCNCSALA